MSLDTIIESLIDRKIDARLAEVPTSKPSTTITEDAQALINQYEVVSHKTYLNKKEIALYLGVSERSVEEWSSRAQQDNPLPVGYVGSDMRAKREKLDQWVEGETRRKRLRMAS